jgi:hypothetical protein
MYSTCISFQSSNAERVSATVQEHINSVHLYQSNVASLSSSTTTIMVNFVGQSRGPQLKFTFYFYFFFYFFLSLFFLFYF